MNELELKLRVPPDALPALRDRWAAQGATMIRLRADYYDTADGALSRRQMVLRLRQENQRWVQTFKAAGDSPVHRIEHEVVIEGLAPDEAPTVDVTRHDGTPAEALLRDALSAAADGASPLLVRRQGTEVERLRCTTSAPPDSVVEVALDVGRVVAGKHAQALAEIEFEHVHGRVDGVFALARDALSHGGLWLSTLSKAARGDRLLSGEAPAAARATTVSYDRRADGVTVLKAVLGSALAQVLANASEVAEGADDADVVHQLRVGLRRLRTALRELGPFSDRIAPEWEPALAATFAQLGDQRDRLAVIDAVQPLLSAVGITPPPLPEDAVVDVVAAVRSPAFQHALLGVLSLLHIDHATSCGACAAREALARRLGKLHRQVRRDGRRFDTLSVDDQHRVRKRLKRLRYLAEFAAPLWPRQAVKRYLRRLRPMHDLLGTHNDVAVASGLYRQGEPSAASTYAAGYLQGHLGTTAAEARHALKTLRQRDRFWR